VLNIPLGTGVVKLEFELDSRCAVKELRFIFRSSIVAVSSIFNFDEEDGFHLLDTSSQDALLTSLASVTADARSSLAETPSLQSFSGIGPIPITFLTTAQTEGFSG